jgi:hypothetical protein
MPDTPEVAVLESQQADWSVAHDGYTSIYTVDGNGDLQESYLAKMGGSWVTQNLSSNAPNMPGTPAVALGTIPIAITHDGYTSVFTIDRGDSTHHAGDLQETYLPVLGGPWFTHDLSSNATGMAQTPAVATATSPTAVFHDGYLSVFTVDKGDSTHHAGDLQETYLPLLGGPWFTHDLSSNALASTPAVETYTSPVALVHDGYTSVYTVDGNRHLWETYLAVLGGPWVSQDLTAKYHTPVLAPATSPTAVYHDGFTSVYTVDANSGPIRPTYDLQETYLPAIGDSWVTQDLSAKYGLPSAIPGFSPVALYHTGFTSVYYLDGTSNGLDEAYLPAIGDAWGWNALWKSPPGTPQPDEVPSPLVHYDTSGGLTWTSVYTVDFKPTNDIQETYLPAIGDKWVTQNLSTENPPATPPW